MCIRDRSSFDNIRREIDSSGQMGALDRYNRQAWDILTSSACLLYTSDAADERSSVDLGGRRIIKKKTHGYRARGGAVTRESHNVNRIERHKQIRQEKKV